MRLTRCYFYGRYQLPDGRVVNIHKGILVGRGYDVFFYIYRQRRVVVSASDISSKNEIHPA